MPLAKPRSISLKSHAPSLSLKRATPSTADRAIWKDGSRTVTNARREFNLSRDELFAIMADGTLHWCEKDLKGTRLIAYGDLVNYVASLYAAQKRTPD